MELLNIVDEREKFLHDKMMETCEKVAFDGITDDPRTLANALNKHCDDITLRNLYEELTIVMKIRGIKK